MKNTNGLRRAVWTLAALLSASSGVLACASPGSGIGVSRVIEIDTSNGPLFGKATKFERQESILKPGEVVLTFDDGPTPRVTTSILKTLDRHCTRATFFVIGKRVAQFPDILRDTIRAGHTIGAHSWSHPNNLTRLKRADAHDQIERGFAAIDIASGPTGIAPFFRFTGLNDGRALLGYTQERKLGVFTVDVISNDSFARSAAEVVRTTMSRVRANKGGILLFHDLRRRSASALPDILDRLKREGFKVVHLRAKTPFKRDPAYDSALRPGIEKTLKRRAAADALSTPLKPKPLPASVPVTRLAPDQARFDPENDRPARSTETSGTSADTATPSPLRTTYGPNAPGN
jgi:peptidoglycan/xylan/chitin deacetylase (PgdA/CDA1 family)